MTCSSCRAAPVVRAGFEELNLLCPGRDRSGDGACASSQHHSQNPTSDHEPQADVNCNGSCLAMAGDYTKDILHGADMKRAFRALTTVKPAEALYAIHDGEMIRSYPANGQPAWTVQPYHVPPGGSSHPHHMHVSYTDASACEERPLLFHRLFGLTPGPPPTPQPSTRRSTMLAVKTKEVHAGGPLSEVVGWVTQNGLVWHNLTFDTYVLITSLDNTQANGELWIGGSKVGDWSAAGDQPTIVQPDRSGNVEIAMRNGDVLVEVRESAYSS